MKNIYENYLFSVVIITYGRRKELIPCLESVIKQTYKNFEIILIDNNKDKNISNYILEEVLKLNDQRIYYFKAGKNLGVTGGRNYGIKKAKGDVLVFIDDDAFLESISTFKKIYERMTQNDKTGVLSFKIVNYYTKKIEKKTFPHRNKKLNPDKEFETTYFLGGGCAIKKEVFDKVGLYSEDFFYGMEELDLSFKIINAGYRIFYFPAVIVFHKKSPEGRLKNKEMWQKTLENRIKVAIRNLPWRYVFISSFIWMGKVFLETRGDVRVIFTTLKNLIKNKEKLKRGRIVIGSQTIKRLKELQGRLLY